MEFIDVDVIQDVCHRLQTLNHIGMATAWDGIFRGRVVNPRICKGK